MDQPRALHIALPVERSTLPTPETGLTVAETGDLMLCAGRDLHTLRLDAEGWAWLANVAAGMTLALTLQKRDVPAATSLQRLTHGVSGHA